MTPKRKVSAGLDLIAERRKNNPSLGAFLDSLDRIEDVIGTDVPDDSAPRARPYSGAELDVTERWK